jgi:hypothetical protein
MTLNGPSNYQEWAFSVKTILRGHGLASHLTDAPPADKSKDGSGAAAVTQLGLMMWPCDECHCYQYEASFDYES